RLAACRALDRVVAIEREVAILAQERVRSARTLGLAQIVEGFRDLDRIGGDAVLVGTLLPLGLPLRAAPFLGALAPRHIEPPDLRIEADLADMADILTRAGLRAEQQSGVEFIDASLAEHHDIGAGHGPAQRGLHFAIGAELDEAQRIAHDAVIVADTEIGGL